MKPTISVIIVNYNTKKLVEDCIVSVKKNTSIPFEIIVVENSSQEGFTLPTKDFRLIVNKENLGFAKAVNQGIEASHGKYILLLNSDTLIRKGAIDKLAGFAEKTPDAGVVGAKLLNKDGSVQASCFNFPGIAGALKQYWFGEKGHYDKFAPSGISPVGVDAIVGAAFLITPQALKKAGKLDPRYFMYFEDLDYCRKVKKAGLKTYYLPRAEIVHYHGESGKGIAGKSNQWRRLIPSSKIYHGRLKHFLLTAIMWLGQRLNRNLLLALLITALIVPTFFRLVQPGFFPMQDDLQAFRVQQMDKCFDDFQIPCRWVPDAGYQYGYPQFIYYPPSVYYVGALLHRIGLQYIDAVKVLFVLGYIASALAMFVLVKSFLGNWPGVVAALIYSYVPYKAVEVFVRGALNEFWSLAFLPLAFWATYRLTTKTKTRYIIWTAISILLLLTTHSLISMIFAPFLLVWIVYWVYTEKKWKVIGKIILAGLLGLGLSAFYLIPLLLERKYAHLESLLSGYFDYRAHFVNVYKLFLSTEWGYGSSGFPAEKLNLSTGIVQWLVGILAGALAAFRFKKETKLATLTFVLAGSELLVLFMMHLKSSFIWEKLPFLHWLQFPWRFLSISIFLLAILSGLAVYFAGKYRYLLGIAAVIAAFILYANFFVPKDWLNITDTDKFSGASWEKQLTISIFDYLPIYAKLPPPSKAPDVPEVLEGEANFISYEKGSNFQKGEVAVTKEALVRLPIFDFPGMRVMVDGEVVPHSNNDCRGQEYCLGLISFNIGPGMHKIEVKLGRTPARWVGDVISLVTVGFVVAVWLRRK